MNEEDYRGFYDDLKEAIDKIDGKYSELLRFCPKFFNLLCEILKDKKTDWHTKLLVNSALAYFVLPEDIIPDYEESGEGYIDDLFLTAFVLVEIKNNVDKNLLIENWREDSDILSIVEDIHDRTKIILGEKYIDILRLVGLRKYVSLDLNDYDNCYPKKIAKLANEKRELLGLLSFVISKIYNSSRTREMDKLVEFLKEHEDYDEIERIIHLAKEKNTHSDDIEEETDEDSVSLRKRRVERLLRGKRDDS